MRTSSLKILLVGATGLVGTALNSFLNTGGHEVRVLSRSKKLHTINWNPEEDRIPKEALEHFDAVINLAGENIAGRWTEDKKRKIRESRVKSTELLCRTLSDLYSPPAVLINASAIGFYGNRGDELVTETSSPGNDFLADVCKEWEGATRSASKSGIRVIHARFGAVLSAKGGALATMLTPFKFGLGGPIGNGEQWMSWIAIDDLLGVIRHLLANKEISGPVNVVTPNPVRNKEFTKILGKVLNRPTILPLPAFMARALLGEMADTLLLGSTRVAPTILEKSGYKFLFPELENALKHLIGV